jgi:GT2 family glycosyltransferase
MPKPSVTLIAVSYFGAVDADHLVDSLLLQTFGDWELVLADNSVDDVEHRKLLSLSERDSRIRVLSPGSNLGYFGAAQFALEAEAPLGHVVVMNTDLVFGGPGVLGDLYREAEGSEDIGVLAPAIISSRTSRDQNPHMPEIPALRTAAKRRWATATPLLAQVTLWVSDVRNRRRPSPTVTDVEPRDIYAAHGSFMYFTRRYFASLGDFRHPLFLFGEEVYVAEHVRQHGLRILYLPRVELRHVEHGTMGIRRPRSLLKMSGLATKYALEAAKRAHGARLSA